MILGSILGDGGDFAFIKSINHKYHCWVRQPARVKRPLSYANHCTRSSIAD
jgi:hypothetical protein